MGDLTSPGGRSAPETGADIGRAGAAAPRARGASVDGGLLTTGGLGWPVRRGRRALHDGRRRRRVPPG